VKRRFERKKLISLPHFLSLRIPGLSAFVESENKNQRTDQKKGQLKKLISVEYLFWIKEKKRVATKKQKIEKEKNHFKSKKIKNRTNSR
jgi:hypothetical protein